MRRKTVLALAGLAIVIAAAIFVWRSRQASALVFREARVERGTIDVTILATGTAQPENRLEIKPPIAGRVEKVLAREGQVVRRGQLLAMMSSTERAAMLDAARAKGAEELKRWEEMYRPTPVLAPINGTIILRNVESGQTFTNNDSIFVMSDRLTVKAQVDETDIAKIQLKQSAEIVLDAYPDQKLLAKVDQIAYDAKTVNNVTTYVVDVLPNATPKFMRSGMTANVTFLVQSKPNILVVPADALRARDGKMYALMKGVEGAEPVEREVVSGLSDGKRTEVVSGVSEGDFVLTAQLKSKERAKKGTSPFSPMSGGGGRGRGAHP